MKTLTTIAVAGVLLAGCASLSTPDARLATSCSAYAHALYSLAGAKPELSEAQVQTVNNARQIANPICINHEYASRQSALDAVTRQVAELNGIEVNTDEQ